MASTIAARNEEAAKTIYTPLKQGTIRILHLHPAEDPNSDVVCSLEHARLDDKPEYQALSYVWGSQDDPREICLNGTTVFVTRNLYKALRRLRLKRDTRVIWIDALAINQSDIAERNAEVQVMRDIYSGAFETLAWFDKSLNTDVEYIMSTLAVPYKYISANENPYGIQYALRTIASQSYWSRIWTAQEVRYSRQVTLVTTYREVPFDRLQGLQESVTYLLSKKQHFKQILDMHLRNFQRKCLTVRPLNLSDEGHVDLSTWIDMCCLRTCSDPRDYVFGLWAWFLPQVKSRVRVDYFLSTPQVLGSCKKAFLLTTGTLDYLGLSNLFDHTAADLPAWDPELYFRGSYRTSEALRCSPEQLGLDHCRRWSQSVFTRVSEDLRTLHVKGSLLGTVAMAAAKMADAPFRHSRDFFRFTVTTMQSLQVKMEEAEEFTFAIRPLYAYAENCTNLLEDLIQVAEFLNLAESQRDPIPGDILDICCKYRRLLRAGEYQPIQEEFSVVRLEADVSIATEGEKTRALFGLMWFTTAEPGDQVYLVHGCSRALLLRPDNRDPEKHRLIGAIFFPGPDGKENPVIDELLNKHNTPVTDIVIC